MENLADGLSFVGLLDGWKNYEASDWRADSVFPERGIIPLAAAPKTGT